MLMDIRRIPITRTILVLFPILFSARAFVTAAFSIPTGPFKLGHPVVFDATYIGAGVLYLYWSAIAHRHLLRSVYIGISLGMLCMYRAVTVSTQHEQFGRVIYSAVVNWMTFSIATLAIMLLSVQYIMFTRGYEPK